MAIKIKSFDEFRESLTERGYYNEIYLETMREYFGDDIPNCVYESIESGEYTDFILENLKTHDINLLQKKIKEKFGEKHPSLEFINPNDKNCSLAIISQTKLDDEMLKNLLDFFGYYVSSYKVGELDGYQYHYYLIGSTYASDANDLVHNKNYGKLYHFSTGENAKEIERTGLRCKSKEYRFFPKRIYAYSSCKKLKEIPGIYEKINTVVNPIDAKKYGIYVYRIDLTKSDIGKNINFYTDDMMDDEDAVYTYSNIPPECIKLVDVIKL
jgi:hypothetical protein